MKTKKQPFALLTIRRIAELTDRSVSEIQHVIDEQPGISPVAVADYMPVFDRNALEYVEGEHLAFRGCEQWT